MYTASTRVVNSRSTALTLRMEPWGDEYQVPPGASYLISVESHSQGVLEIVCANDAIEVWAWSGSTAAVTCDDVKEVKIKAAPR
jgi:hypothetical protein